MAVEMSAILRSRKVWSGVGVLGSMPYHANLERWFAAIPVVGPFRVSDFAHQLRLDLLDLFQKHIQRSESSSQFTAFFF